MHVPDLNAVWIRLLLVGVIISLGTGFSATAQDMPGIAVGKSASTFQARDQFDKQQTISPLMGRNGLVLVFFRSADWNEKPYLLIPAGYPSADAAVPRITKKALPEVLEVVS